MGHGVIPSKENTMVHNQSEDISSLSEALSKFQGELQSASKDSKNPFFNSDYATLTSVWDSIREPLAKHGLAVTQTSDVIDGKDVLVTTLTHKSGQWIRGLKTLNPSKQDPQGEGSVITYMRRYMLAAIVGQTQKDDDGNIASGKEQKPTKPQAKKSPPKKPLDDVDDIPFFDEELDKQKSINKALSGSPDDYYGQYEDGSFYMVGNIEFPKEGNKGNDLRWINFQFNCLNGNKYKCVVFFPNNKNSGAYNEVLKAKEAFKCRIVCDKKSENYKGERREKYFVFRAEVLK